MIKVKLVGSLLLCVICNISFAKEDSIRVKKCMQAFGHYNFCQCIDNSTAKNIAFADYIFILTHSKEAIGYNLLPEENQKAIDTTYKARKQCDIHVKK